MPKATYTAKSISTPSTTGQTVSRAAARIVADDPKYGQFLVKFRERILKIVEDWDRWRIKHREEGDPDNERLTKKERASHGLYGAVSKEYGLSKGKKNRGKVGGWVDELAADAAFNFESYAECFISENLVRKFIKERKLPLSKEAIEEAGRWKKAETDNKNKGTLAFESVASAKTRIISQWTSSPILWTRKTR